MKKIGANNIELNVTGSNLEKISDIIKIWIYPMKTLKVFSLVNLIFYVLIRESHHIVVRGLIM
jgi:hypothetical protein